MHSIFVYVCVLQRFLMSHIHGDAPKFGKVQKWGTNDEKVKARILCLIYSGIKNRVLGVDVFRCGELEKGELDWWTENPRAKRNKNAEDTRRTR